MKSALQNVASGSVTYAVRTTTFNGNSIQEGDIIGIIDGNIEAVDSSVEGASKALLRKMLSNASEDAVVTIFYGENMDEENANALVADVQADFPNAEFIVQNGGQPLYYYYFAVE